MKTTNKRLHPSNQFSVRVNIPFPNGLSGESLMKWFNLQNFGTEFVSKNRKISEEQKERAWKLHACHAYKFVFQITEEGDWMFIGRKG
jgi:hypothetical protein